MAAVWQLSQHSGSALLALLALADFSDDAGRSYPSVSALARKCRLTTRHMNRVLRMLVDSGELTIRPNTGPRGTNTFYVGTPTRVPPLTNASPLTQASPTPDADARMPLTSASPEPSVNHQEPPAICAETPAHCPVQKIIDAYHAAMPNNPRVKILNERRRKLIGARWREAAKLACEPFGYATVADGLVAWAKFFEICGQSDFLTGRTTGSNGRPPFVADIDFLMSPAGFTKTLENKYHRETA